jgi:hypothetical protein
MAVVKYFFTDKKLTFFFIKNSCFETEARRYGGIEIYCIIFTKVGSLRARQGSRY